LDNRNFPDRRGPMWSADVIGEGFASHGKA
jgi:hypothetical protein